MAMKYLLIPILAISLFVARESIAVARHTHAAYDTNFYIAQAQSSPPSRVTYPPLSNTRTARARDLANQIATSASTTGPEAIYQANRAVGHRPLWDSGPLFHESNPYVEIVDYSALPDIDYSLSGIAARSRAVRYQHPVWESGSFFDYPELVDYSRGLRPVYNPTSFSPEYTYPGFVDYTSIHLHDEDCYWMHPKMVHTMHP